MSMTASQRILRTEASPRATQSNGATGTRQRVAVGLVIAAAALAVASKLVGGPLVAVAALLAVGCLLAAGCAVAFGGVIDRGGLEPRELSPTDAKLAAWCHRLAMRGRSTAVWIALAGLIVCLLMVMAVENGYETRSLKVLLLGPVLLLYGVGSLIDPRLLTRCWDPADWSLNRFHAATLGLVAAGFVLGMGGYLALLETHR